MPELSSSQRKQLRTMAHHLEPAVLIGKQGITDMLMRAIAESLEAHELIKVRFNDFKTSKDALSEEIVRRTGAERVGMVGHVLILDRRHPEPEKRRIELA